MIVQVVTPQKHHRANTNFGASVPCCRVCSSSGKRTRSFVVECVLFLECVLLMFVLLACLRQENTFNNKLTHSTVTYLVEGLVEVAHRDVVLENGGYGTRGHLANHLREHIL